MEWAITRPTSDGGNYLVVNCGAGDANYQQVRDFVPVEEVAAQLLAACSRRSIEPGVARIENLGTARPTTGA